MNDAIYVKRIDNIELRIYPDYDAESPRDEENLGAFWSEDMHRRYNFHEPEASEVLYRLIETERKFMGDGGEGTAGWDNVDWIRHLLAISSGRRHAYVILPVYMCDHGGLSFSTSGFTDSWDSGVIGFIMCDVPRWDRFMGGVVWDPAQAETHLRGEIQTLDNFHVYGAYYFELIEYTKCECCGHEESDQLESCSGYYGPVEGEYGARESMKEMLDAAQWPLIEDWI